MPHKQEFLVVGRPMITPVHPGDILKEDVLPALKLTVTEAARQLGVSRQSYTALWRANNQYSC